ncbi:MAG: hypothetical protein GAK43_02731 [Stenotrophomonas maltophilia]|nr:MAG: hypothetical protein GAK43_02731 [Stenotrophomonas maltophilia]
MRLLLVGASGLVGSQVLAQALGDPRVDSVVALVRRPIAEHPRLQALLVDFDALPESAPWWQADALICTLGTTRAKAGSPAAFRRVDHDYPLDVGRLALRAGTPTCVLNSALGANADSRIFYNRVKGEVERDITALGFRSLTLVRPGLIGGEREEFRAGERLASVVLGALGPLLPRGWRINPAAHIARAMLDAALASEPGIRLISAERLV